MSKISSFVTLDDGTQYEAEIGTIHNTFIGIEDHGILGMNIDFDFGGVRQGTGVYYLSSVYEQIPSILSVCGVQEWEKLKGRSCYVLRDDARGMIRGIMSFHGDKHVLFGVS